MNQKNILLILIISVALTLLTGCGSNIPFETHPDSSITIESIDKNIANAEKDEVFYKKYFQYRVLGIYPEGLKDMMMKLSEEELEKKCLNGEKLFMLNLIIKTEPEESNRLVLEEIQNYIKASKMGEKNLDFVLLPELEQEQPIEKVQDYMTKNKIQIKDITFTDSFESVNTWMYPMRYTYKYVIIGTMKGKDFEKEIIQDFYIGADIYNDWQERIEYIK